MGRGGAEGVTTRDATASACGTGSMDDLVPNSVGGMQRPIPQGLRYDRLTVFQAAPLVWKDQEDNLHTVEMLEFDREREILTESMKEARTLGAEIELVFEPATTDRLGAFLAANETQVLHFTCHGLPQFLAIEDGLGGAHFLRDDDLRDFMSAGNGELLFVFVSACYSRAAGEAFLEAGVPHVVCCQHDEPLMDLAAQEFSRSFYLSLACGRNLRQSFELAKQAVKLCPQIPDAANEMRKFLLLPEDAEHDVPIFFSKPRKRSFGLKPAALPSPWILPPPPEVFVGREMEMYKVIQKLGMSRLVRITGCPGSGKASVAAAVARYISMRERSFALFDEVIWLPLIYTTRIDKLSSCFYELFAILQDESLAMSLPLNADYRRVCGAIFEALYQTKALLVIETKAFLESQSINKLSIFLHDLFRGTKYVRVLLICQQWFEISLRNSVVESEVVVEPLDFEATASLFGRLCPYVSDHRYSRACTPRQLSNILVPKEKADIKPLSKRCDDIFRMIGGGVPSEIHIAAREMKPEEYDMLIDLGERLEYNADCKTRVELEVQLERLREDIQIAVREKNFQKAKEIQGALDELERHREALPEIEELRRMASDLKDDLDRAVSQKNFSEAENLSHQLDLVNKKIEVEINALLVYDRDSKPSESEEKDETQLSRFSTRAGLECEIRKLQNELDDAVEQRDFPGCRRIQGLIDDLSSRRESLPSREEMEIKITSMKADLDSAVAARDFAKAESLHCQIQELEEKVVLEKESEDNFVAATAVMIGKQLAELGDALQHAVDDQEHSRVKELEARILKEAKGLEERFTLRYSQQPSANSPNSGDLSRVESMGDNDLTGTGVSDGSTGVIAPPRTKSKSSPPALSARLRAPPYVPMPNLDAKRATTIARIPPSSTAFIEGGGGQTGAGAVPRTSAPPSTRPAAGNVESRPGAVAVPGVNELEGRERSPRPSAGSVHERTEYPPDASSQPAQAQSQTGHGRKTSDLRHVQERFEQGLCPTCPFADNATQCFVFKNSTTDPRVRTRIPLTIEGLVHEGKCLICNPDAREEVSRGSTDERMAESSSEQRLDPSPAPVAVPSARNTSPVVPTTPENAGILAPDIAVATRVDAVAQEEAIERIVRDAIRRVAEGTEERVDSCAVPSAAVGRILSYEHADSTITRMERNGVEDEGVGLSSDRNRPKKKSFMKGVLKFGKKKKDS